jgi:hypothetical protein
MHSRVIFCFLLLCTLTCKCCIADGVAGPSDAPQPGRKRLPRTNHVLDAQRFFGEAREAYRAATDCQKILGKLFCYSGDDVTEGHRSLLDCFTTIHAVDEPLCQREAILAAQMYKQGKPLREIQKAIDEKFGPQYPFAEESSALKAYKQRRLWKPVQNK